MDNISQNEKLSTIVKALDSKRAEDITNPAVRL